MDGIDKALERVLVGGVDRLPEEPILGFECGEVLAGRTAERGDAVAAFQAGKNQGQTQAAAAAADQDDTAQEGSPVRTVSSRGRCFLKRALWSGSVTSSIWAGTL